MLKKLKIRSRILLAVGSVLGLAMIPTAIGLLALKRVSDQASGALDVEAKTATLAAEARIANLLLRRYEKDVFLNISDAEKRKSYEEKWQAAHEHLSQTLSELTRVAGTDRQKELVRSMEEAGAIYAAGFQKVREAIDAGEVKTP